MNAQPPQAPPIVPSRFYYVLKLFTDVRPGESITALLLALNIFLILMGYYVLKPVREALILGQGTAELKTYMSALQVVVLAFVVPYYGRLVARMDRLRVINTVTAFFVVCLVVFFALGQARVPLGIVYFLWIGIFNLMVVAQFWSFANDIYTKDQGERLFPIVGFGASLGAVFGSRFAGVFIASLGVLDLMLVGAAILVIQAALTNYIDRRQARLGGGARTDGHAASCRRDGRRGQATGQRLSAGLQDEVPAADGLHAAAGQYRQHDGRVHPRPHRA